MTRKRATPEPPPRPAPTIRAAPGSRAQGEASLVVVYGTELGRRIPLSRAPVTIGRSSKADLFLDEEAVSRQHAKILYEHGRHVIVDLRSSNGTRVNDERVAERVLDDGDRIQIGRTFLAFLSGANVTARYEEQIYRLMTLDGLTGVHNARYFFEALEREHKRALRYARSLSVALFEVRLVAKGGEPEALATDAALRQVASLVGARLREQDVFGRLGGSLFGIILPESDPEGARHAAEKVRALVLGLAPVHEEMELQSTASVGVATLSPESPRSDDLVAAARKALAGAKAGGGNRVVFAGDGK